MTKRNKLLVLVIILLTALVVYNVCFFAIPLNRELSRGALWITYAFTYIFTAACGAIAVLAFNHDKLRSRVLGVPIFYVGTGALVLQYLLDIAVMAIGNFLPFYWWAALIVEVFIAGGTVVFMLLRTSYRAVIEANDKQRAADTSFMYALRREVKTLLARDIPKLEMPLSRLYERARYSDPVSTAAVTDIEDEILSKLDELKKYITTDLTKSQALIEDMIRLLKERSANLR